MLPVAFEQLLKRVTGVLPAQQPVYLVGGAVRDLILGKTTHDLDFVIRGDVLALARRVGDRLKGAYYPLDEERGTARVILSDEHGNRQILDFAAIRGSDIESDLRSRDFTINAIAVELGIAGEGEAQTEASHHLGDIGKLLDPTNGIPDLRSGILRACSPDTFQQDPLRTLRAVRQATAFHFRIEPETRELLKKGFPGLKGVSAERIRDELIRIFDGPQAASALRSLQILGGLPFILPELVPLQGESQSPPHTLDVWNHTLEVMQRLDSLLEVLSANYKQSSAASLAMGEVSLRLGRYREKIETHLDTYFTPDRSLRPLLFLAALYHDAGKATSRSVDQAGRIRFFDHEKESARLLAIRAQKLHMSRVEIDRLEKIARHHMRPLLLAQEEHIPSPRAVYRFFRDTGPAGVDICLLSLADTLGIYGPTLPQEKWAHLVQVVRALLEAWWEQADERIHPTPLLSGTDLMDELGLQPGPLVGRLLEVLREAQATGEVNTREGALEWAKEHLSDLS